MILAFLICQHNCHSCNCCFFFVSDDSGYWHFGPNNKKKSNQMKWNKSHSCPAVVLIDCLYIFSQCYWIPSVALATCPIITSVATCFHGPQLPLMLLSVYFWQPVRREGVLRSLFCHFDQKTMFASGLPKILLFYQKTETNLGALQYLLGHEEGFCFKGFFFFLCLLFFAGGLFQGALKIL